MEKFFAIFKLGIKYLYRYRRRYAFLLAALVFGFAIVTFITSAKDGMYDSVYFSAQSHYAGDVVVVGYESRPDKAAGEFDHRMGQNEITAVMNAADRAGINPQYTTLRTLHGNNGIVHYNGNAIQLRYLVGCDWDRETPVLNRMVFDEPPDPAFGNDGIILSVPVARQLGAKMGDSLILEADTRWGQKNTGQFTVRGIVQDTSIFGYFKAYISRLALNRLIDYSDEDCSSIGFFLEDPRAAEQARRHLHTFLSEQAQAGPLVYDREGMARERDRPWEGIRVFLYTMPVYLSEVASLLDAMNLLVYFLYAMMLLLILVSAAVTYRLILNERVKEMGIMRAIGFYGGELRLVLWVEIVILGAFSMVAGFLLALLLNWAVSLLSFSWFPSFEIFTKNGSLQAMYLPGTMLANAASIILVLLVLALFPSFRVSRKKLPELLSGEPL
jgi:putative ABC transport system permease protein